jgi:hypothetical protein
MVETVQLLGNRRMFCEVFGFNETQLYGREEGWVVGRKLD